MNRRSTNETKWVTRRERERSYLAYQSLLIQRMNLSMMVLLCLLFLTLMLYLVVSSAVLNEVAVRVFLQFVEHIGETFAAIGDAPAFVAPATTTIFPA
ncbi:MAG TPA: hypothetical protein PKW95_09220 [bacterium]|nr:hypothetical protein [bacterium]